MTTGGRRAGAAMAAVSGVALAVSLGAPTGEVARWALPSVFTAAAVAVLARAVVERRERVPWLIIGAAMSLLASGWWANRALNWERADVSVGMPAALWLSFYPLMYFGLYRLARSRVKKLDASLLFDSAIIALSITAVLDALLVPVLTDWLTMDRNGDRTWPTLVSVGRAAGDGLLMTGLLTIVRSTPKDARRPWYVLLGAMLLLTVGDIAWGVETARGIPVVTSPLMAAFIAAAGVLAVIAWLPTEKRDTRPERRAPEFTMLPFAFGFVSVGVLFVGAEPNTDIPPLATALASLALAFVLVRLLATQALNRRLVAQHTRRQTVRRLAIVNNTADGVFEWDTETGEGYWSPRLREMLGIPMDEPATIEASMEALHANDRKAIEPLYRRLREGGQPLAREVRIRNRLTGEYLPCLLRMQLQPLDGSSLIIGTVHDISPTKEAERQRVALAQELHDSVAQDVAVARGLTQLALKHPEELADRERQAAEALVRQLEEADHSVRLLMSSLRAASDPEKPSNPSTFITVVEDAVAAVRRDHQDIGCSVSVDVPDGALPAVEPLRAFSRILDEAVRNVIKHAGASQLHVQLQVDEDCLRLSVSDNGGGFDIGAAPPEGHWGLKGMRERAEAVGGTLFVESSQNGTTLRVELPNPLVAPPS